jgi:uncharacterized membrane protein YdfJ with MMPL/SSD domain
VARWSFRHCRLVLGTAACLLTLGAFVGLSMGSQWSNGGYTAQGTAAQRAESAARQFAAGTPDLILYARSGLPVDSPEVVEQGRRLTELAARSPSVASALSYWNTGLGPLRAADGRGALLRIDLRGGESEAARTARTLVPALRAATPGLRLSANRPAWVNVTATDQAERDLLRSELFSLPVTFTVLVLAFGSLGATLVPVAIGATAASGALALLAVPGGAPPRPGRAGGRGAGDVHHRPSWPTRRPQGRGPTAPLCPPPTASATPPDSRCASSPEPEAGASPAWCSVRQRLRCSPAASPCPPTSHVWAVG